MRNHFWRVLTESLKHNRLWPHMTPWGLVSKSSQSVKTIKILQLTLTPRKSRSNTTLCGVTIVLFWFVEVSGCVHTRNNRSWKLNILSEEIHFKKNILLANRGGNNIPLVEVSSLIFPAHRIAVKSIILPCGLSPASVAQICVIPLLSWPECLSERVSVTHSRAHGFSNTCETTRHWLRDSRSLVSRCMQINRYRQPITKKWCH